MCCHPLPTPPTGCWVRLTQQVARFNGSTRRDAETQRAPLSNTHPRPTYILQHCLPRYWSGSNKNPDEYLEDEYQNPIISIKQYLYIVFFLFFWNNCFATAFITHPCECFGEKCEKSHNWCVAFELCQWLQREEWGGLLSASKIHKRASSSLKGSVAGVEVLKLPG